MKRISADGLALVLTALVIVFFVQLFGCVNAEVARGPDTPRARKEIDRLKLMEFGEWNYSKLRVTGGDKLYAIKIEKEGEQLVAHCLESVHDFHGDSYGPFTPSIPWQKCENRWILSLLEMIEA